MSTNGQVLTAIVSQVIQSIRAISDSDARIKPGPKRWSKKEILGHLIDSANNNHRRFVIAHLQKDLVFEGYSQEDWVSIQDYQSCDWQVICDLWESYNLHIAIVIDRIAPEILLQERRPHCLDKMAYKPVPASEPATLDYLVKDYIGHLEHHVRQILPDYVPVMMGTYEFQAQV